MESPRIYLRHEIEQVLRDPAFDGLLMDALSDGFRQFSSHNFQSSPIQTLGAVPLAPFRAIKAMVDPSEYSAQTCVKSGYLLNGEYYVIKIASGGKPFPHNSGLMQLFSQDTGRLEAILLDDGLLTEVRTAATGALSAKLFAPNNIRVIGILGSGIQARYQLQYLKLVTDCRQVLVYGRTKSNVDAFILDCRAEGWLVDAVQDPDDLLERCQLIVTTTSSRQALLGASTRKSTSNHMVHITCIGADAPGKMELSPYLIQACDLLIADSRVQTAERGEFQHAIQSGLVQKQDIVELGEWLNTLAEKEKDYGNGPHKFSIFDSSGLAVQDCVIASMVLNTLKKERK